MHEYEELISAVKSELSQMEADVARRNDYMNERDEVIYGEGLFDGLEFVDGADKTLFNFCDRVINIHTSQLMGRGFNVYSSYNKEEAPAEPIQQSAQQATETEEEPEAQPQDPDAQAKLADAKNKLVQSNADVRKRLIDGMIRDNGGMATFKNGARVGGVYGTTVLKMWADKKNKRIRWNILETPQNFYVGWSSSNFREFDWAAYVYQISESSAYKQYGDKLPDGGMFNLTQEGAPLSDGRTADPLNTVSPAHTAEDTKTKRPMVSVIEFTGIVPKWGANKNGEIVQVDRGKETPINVLIVGDHCCQKITDEDMLPRYYIVRNNERPRRAWGVSDISNEAIEINRTLIEVMSTWITLFNREVSPVYLAKGFEGQRIPQRKRKQTTFIPMTPEQTIQMLEHAGAYTGESKQIVEELKDAFVRVTNISRIMFDDPTINPTSNQALMTTMKGLIDAVEDKQARWEAVLTQMFTEALELTAKMLPEMAGAITKDEGWHLNIKWPSVLRREDATYQQMYLNRFNSGTLSVSSYLEAMGEEDTTEEIDRIRDELKDPTTAAVLGRQVGALAQQVITPPQPQGPDVKVNLRGDLTPYQEANLATQQGFNDGPFPPTAGPQGQQGLAAQENADNVGFIEGNAFNGGTPIQQGPDGQPVQEDQPNPQLTVDQNAGQTASQPGSGAPAVSPEGAINQMEQRNGA